MAVLTYEIARKMQGALQEREDWWRLCYDTVSRAFYVEHEWHHMDAYNIGNAANEGKDVFVADGYLGKGADRIGEAKAALLEQAGHA
ncbi:hypothetical protein [uncultured Celeribacter sp.]|uniref:hypothetical protein n=1 Tax=uncultured Celeribacter sp. TaxID=1303376 RepID=UPI002AA815A5|nr:hypothetical protein [uncultured Celeribacter sp.]